MEHQEDASTRTISRAIGEELRRAREATGWSRGQLVAQLPSGIGDRTLLSYYGDATVSTEADAAAFVVDSDTPDAGAFLVDIETGETRELAGDAAEAVAFGDDAVLVQRDDDGLEVWDARGTDRIRTSPATSVTRGPLPS